MNSSGLCQIAGRLDLVISIIYLFGSISFVNGQTKFFNWVEDNGILSTTFAKTNFKISDENCLENLTKPSETKRCLNNNMLICMNLTTELCLSGLEIDNFEQKKSNLSKKGIEIHFLFIDEVSLADITVLTKKDYIKYLKILYIKINGEYKVSSMVNLLLSTRYLKTLVLINNMDDEDSDATENSSTKYFNQFHLEEFVIIGRINKKIMSWLRMTNMKHVNLKFNSNLGSSSYVNGSNIIGGLRSKMKRIPYKIVVFVVISISLISILIARKWWAITYYLKVFILTKGKWLFKSTLRTKANEFRYDVFVSYSESDRIWVLNDLFPYLETKSGMHICLHERDFKVGLGIMENIIECMYSSHCLLLVISKAFVKSKWCQFEMHLGQYFMIETAKPHLILVFLEHIPKNMRPKILHYLMKTRTYIEWPVNSVHHGFLEEKEMFFQRLSYALQQYKNY